MYTSALTIYVFHASQEAVPILCYIFFRLMTLTAQRLACLEIFEL